MGENGKRQSERGAVFDFAAVPNNPTARTPENDARSETRLQKGNDGLITGEKMVGDENEAKVRLLAFQGLLGGRGDIVKRLRQGGRIG